MKLLSITHCILALLGGCTSTSVPSSQAAPTTMPSPPAGFEPINDSRYSGWYFNVQQKQKHKGLDGTEMFVIPMFEIGKDMRTHSWQIGAICAVNGMLVTSVYVRDTGASSYDKRDANLYELKDPLYGVWKSACTK